MITLIENNKNRKLFFLNTVSSSLVIMVHEDNYVFLPYFGSKIEASDIDYIIDGITEANYMADTDNKKKFQLELIPQIYPSYGYTDLKEPAFHFVHKDGSRITDLRYKSHNIYKTKKKLNGLPTVLSNDDSEVLELTLFDELKKVEVIITLAVFEKHNAFTKSVKVINKNPSDDLYIEKIMSANIDIQESNFELIHLAGAWARECHIKRRRLEQGMQSIGSIRGASGHGQNPFAALISPNTDENNGEVFAMNFVYSGNFIISAEADMHLNTRFQMGINDFDFGWTLMPNEEFQTPEAVLIYTNKGLGDMSRTFHKLYQDCLMSNKYAYKERPILINSWESNYFDFNKESLLKLAEEGKNIGAELFVLDDGWFGKRNDDKTSLGDWTPNEQKLGGSLSSLIDDVNKKGISFGLWVEPEMVSPDSDLFRKHPEWAIQVKGRKIETSRHQYVLDLSNPEVCDYIINFMTELLSKNNITYIKWDMNRNITNLGSSYLKPERQKEQAHRYMLGLYRVLDNIVNAFPNVLFESCAGGGGRCDAGMLYYMPQVWTSDDTDAIERLVIQYGASLVYPSISLACHISDIPNHQTRRKERIETRANVAMWGNLGLELNLNKISEEDKKVITQKLEIYKSIRSTVQFGSIYRLKGLNAQNEYAWMHKSIDEETIVVNYVQICVIPNLVTKRLRLEALDSKSKYKVNDSEKLYTGSELMNIGLMLGEILEDAFAIQWIIKKVN
ncbi:alpha-galactosidase [Brachyspira innocens]|uniref:alpha-galactosidase n=1 Tax=Brachyspira innocens TaxID=13264 RepID=UPI0026EE560E|nr:alpha-galactosidase [Brachyspira innocens]MDO6994864.1 alpha-galactosidase [Brachyspira innocens]